MKTLKEKKGYHITKLSMPIFGGQYAVMKNGITIKDGLCLDAAVEIFNNLTQ